MGGLHIDAKDLPLPMREQVAEKIVAQIRQAAPVAGREEATLPVKVPVRKLRFPSAAVKRRYQMLRDAVREGVISDLRLEATGDCVFAMRYRIQWAGEFVPTGIPAATLQFWRTYATLFEKGEQVFEFVMWGV